MRRAEARTRKVKAEEDPVLENLLRELWRLKQTLPLESYLQVIEAFADNARKSLEAISDPKKRAHLREQYRQVIEFAVDLGCGISR